MTARRLVRGFVWLIRALASPVAVKEHRTMRMRNIWSVVIMAGLLALRPPALPAQPVSGSAISTTTCPGDGCLTIPLLGFGSLGLQITGTFSGTIQFEVSNDGVTWTSLAMTPNGGGATVTSTTTTGLWSATIAGHAVARVRFSAYTSGTANIYPVASQARRGTASGFSGDSAAYLLQPVNYTTVQGANIQTSVTTAAITSTTGTLLVAVGCAFGNTIGAAPFSDSKSNTWSLAIASTGTTKGWCAMGYVPALPNAGASHTVTLTVSPADYIVLGIVEVPGIATVSPLNATDADSASGTSHTTGPITSGSTFPEIHIMAGALSAAAEGTPVISTQFVLPVARLPASSTTEGIAFGYRIVPVNTSTTFTYTTTNTQFETALIAGFKSATQG